MNQEISAHVLGFGAQVNHDLVIEPTMVFTLKPRILIKGARPTAQFGDPRPKMRTISRL
jgi:hypothetical protein